MKYVALNPGSSFRGLHDSLVNHLGNEDPQMLLCLHEEHAVAIAHGYAKVAGEPLAVILHSNVGLMHGTMAIFNVCCVRVPVLIYGATGPVDAVLESMLRADVIAWSEPKGPTYVNFDVSIQEKQHEKAPELPDFARYQPSPPAAPSAEGVARAADLPKNAKALGRRF